MKSLVIKRLNDDYYHVKISCGSPCQGHAFIARSKQKDDATPEFITIKLMRKIIV